MTIQELPLILPGKPRDRFGSTCRQSDFLANAISQALSEKLPGRLVIKVVAAFEHRELEVAATA